jgi:hypothetical protein
MFGFAGFLFFYIILTSLEFLVEAVNLTFDVNDALHFATKERVALGADFNADFLFG